MTIEPQNSKLADQRFASLFWCVGALIVAQYLVDAAAYFHSAIEPRGASRVWAPWWNYDHPHALTYWGLVIIAAFLVMRRWLYARGLWNAATGQRGLSSNVFALIGFLLILSWFSDGAIEAIAKVLTGQNEIPTYRPGFEYSVTSETLFGDLLSGVIAAPLFEEVAFRGLFLGCLLARGWTPISAVLLTSFVFGLTHTQYYPSTMIMVMVSGVWLGFLRIYTGGVAAPIIAHGALNFTITVSELLFPD